MRDGDAEYVYIYSDVPCVAIPYVNKCSVIFFWNFIATLLKGVMKCVSLAGRWTSMKSYQI